MIRPRTLLAAGSVGLLVVVVMVAVVAGPSSSQPWLLACGVFAVAAAVQGVAAEPRDLAPALLLALLPVVALVSEDSPTWLIAPLAALLLLTGELQALSWEFRGRAPDGLLGRRLARVGLLVLVALAVSVGLILVGARGMVDGTAGVLVAAVALGCVGAMVFRRGPRRRDAPPPPADGSAT